MKRVGIYVSSLRRGGAERIAIRMAENFKSGYEVTFLINTEDGNQSHAYAYDRDHVINMDLERPSANVLEKIRHNFRRLRVLKKTLRDNEVDVLICFGTRQSILACLIRPFMRTKIIAYEQNVVTEYRLGKVWYNLFKWFYRLADSIVIQTTEGLEMLPERYQPKTTVIGNPIEDPDTEALGTITKARKMVAMGRLVPQKDYPYMIDLFHETAKRHDWTLEIYGQGPLEESLRAKIQGYGLEDRILLKGVTTEPLKVMAESEIFLLTSRFEGFPNVLAEAMSLKMPCITVDCPTGPKDMFGGLGGIICPKEDMAAMADALVALTQDEPRRKTLGEAAYKQIMRFHTPVVMATWRALVDDVSGQVRA